MPKKLVSLSPCGFARIPTENQGPLDVSLIDDDVVVVATNGTLIENTAYTYVNPTVLLPGQYLITGRVTGQILTNAITQITGTLLIDPSYPTIQETKTTTRGNGSTWAEGGWCFSFNVLYTVLPANNTFAVSVTSTPSTTFRIPTNGIYITATRLT